MSEWTSGIYTPKDGLPQTTDADWNFGSVTTGGGLGAFIGGAGGALTGGLLGLIGQGITGWLQAKEAREARVEAEERYNQNLKESVRRWEADQAWTQKRYGLDKAQFMNSLKMQRENMDNYYNERNYQRKQEWGAGLQKILNTEGLRNKFTEAWGR